jgi:hypothetical protein
VRSAISTVTHRIRVADDPQYLTIGQVRRRFGDVSDMWVYRYIRDHGFPKAVKFGGPTTDIGKSSNPWTSRG